MGRTLFTDVNILDCTGAQPYAGEVLVEGNRIKQIAKAGKKLPRDGAHVVDGGGATLMPGLIESHGHISFCDTSTLEGLGDIPPEEHTLKTMKYAKVMLDHGFTAIFSAAAAKPRLDVVIRNAIEEGEIPGPRLRAASPELTVTGGLGDVRRAHIYRETFAICCDGPDEFRKTAREMCREGVDTLKINPSGDEFIPFARAHQTVMNEAEVAESRGKMIAAHTRSAESVKMALRNGVDVLYHCTLSDAEALDMLEAQKDHIFVAPAMGIMYTTATGEGSGYGIDKNHAVAIYFQRELDMCIQNMKKLRKRGVRVLPGGDYGFAWNPIGTNARDIGHFVKLLGYDPMDAIMAATKLGGEIMQMGNELGQIRPGYLADILLVDGNPLTDVSMLRDKKRLLAIMKDGSFHKEPQKAAKPARVAAE